MKLPSSRVGWVIQVSLTFSNACCRKRGGAYQEPSWLFIPYIAHKKTANMFPFPLFNPAIHTHGMIMQNDTINYTPAPFPTPTPIDNHFRFFCCTPQQQVAALGSPGQLQQLPNRTSFDRASALFLATSAAHMVFWTLAACSFCMCVRCQLRYAVARQM